MFPNVSSSRNSGRKTQNTNKFKYVNYYQNSKTLWQDQYPPENIDKIYDDCTTQIQEIKSDLDKLRDEFRIDDRTVIETLTAYSRHLTRLKHVIGLHEIKSAKTMADVVKIIKNNIEFTKREQKRAHELLARNQSDIDDSKESFDDTPKETPKPDVVKLEDDVFSDDEYLVEPKREQTPKLDLTDTINFLQKRRTRTVEPFENLKRSDSIITPILMKSKKERIIVSPETEEDLGYLERLLENTLKALNDYSVSIQKIDKLCAIFDKYFISCFNFVECLFEENSDENVKYEKLLDQVIKYDQKRQEYISFIHGALHNLKRLGETFTDGTHEGISIRRHLSDDSHKLSRRCDCDLVQATLIIPEHNSQLNKCLAYLSQWLEYDRTYFECIQDDMKRVEREKKRLNGLRASAESTFNQLNHKIKLLRESMEAQIAELRDLLRKLNSKSLEDYDEFTGTFIIVPNKKPPSTPVPSQQPSGLYNLEKYSNLECTKLLERVSFFLNDIESDFVRQNRTAINNKAKLGVLEDKFKYLVHSRNSLNNLSTQLFSVYQENCIKQTEIDIWENSFVKLKEIYMCRINSDTVEKIFYNLDITFSRPGQTGANELNASNTVYSNFSDSRKSGSDWVKLYYSLPFYPPRGKETIKKDIEDVLSNLNRGNMEREQGFVTLLKWRRFNSRAKVEDLKTALRSIGRHDIVKEMEKNINRESETKSREAKKSSLQEVDLRKREIEALHQRLVKYLEKTKNGEQTNQFDFKFVTKQI